MTSQKNQKSKNIFTSALVEGYSALAGDQSVKVVYQCACSRGQCTCWWPVKINYIFTSALVLRRMRMQPAGGLVSVSYNFYQCAFSLQDEGAVHRLVASQYKLHLLL